MYVCMHVSVFDEHWEMVLLPNTILMKMEKQERGKKGFLERSKVSLKELGERSGVKGWCYWRVECVTLSKG